MKRVGPIGASRVPVIEIVFPQAPTNVPAFLTKLWKMVDDPGTDTLISWSDGGNSFIIHNQAEFTQGLLPFYYKHSNMASFIRQLNMYGFHKVMNMDCGSLKNDRQEEMEFAHLCFLRGHEEMLEQIRRKVTSKSVPSPPPVLPTNRQDKVSEVLGELNFLRDKQDIMDLKLETMKKENEALWREVVNLRQKHSGQQKIVNKLIQFLMSVVHPRMSSIVKRRYQPQLAIEDSVLSTSGSSNSKVSRLSGVKVVELDPRPTIREVEPNSEDDLDDDFSESMSNSHHDLFNTSDLRAVDPTLVSSTVRFPSSIQPKVASETSVLNSSEKSRTSKSQQGRSNLQPEISRDAFDMETNLMQKDLDSLKEVLSGQITLDTSLFANIFAKDEPLGSYFGLSSDSFLNDISGHGKLSLELDPNLSQSYNHKQSSDDSTIFDICGMDSDTDEQSKNEDNSICGDFSDPLNTPILFDFENDDHFVSTPKSRKRTSSHRD